MTLEMKPLPNDLLKHLTKALVERALQAKLTHHLGYGKSQHAGHGNWRQPPPRQSVYLTDRHTAYFWSGEALRSRSVSSSILSGTVDVPAPPARLLSDWHRDVTLRLCLEPGNVEELPLARARTRWPDYSLCVQAVADWTRTLGLQEVLATSDVALMACLGARYHFDAAQYGGMAFCNLFLSEDCGLDLHFPLTGHRIPLVKGTVVLFDTGQPHGVIARSSDGFKEADFPLEPDLTQIFLTWELPIEQVNVAQLLHITFDTDPATALLLEEEQLWVNGAPASVCPNSGQWRKAE